MFYQSLVQILALCFAFDLKRPEPAEWFMRSRLLCPNPAKYSCLHNDLAPSGYSENCSIVDFEPAGRIIILRGGIDAGDCTQNRYQPARHLYRTNISTDCIYFKSLCNEEGQVVHREDLDSTSDTKCRCDYTRGYDFVARPSHPCYCIPSHEDCSCYLKRCLNTLHFLSTDYHCIHKTQNNLSSSCSLLAKTKINDMDQFFLNITHLTHFQDKRDKLRENIVIVLICCVIIAAGLCLIVLYLRKISNLWHRFRSDYFTKPLGTMTCIEGENVQFECEVLDKNQDAMWFKDGYEVSTTYTYKYKEERQGKLHRLVINETELDDKGQYSVRIKHYVEHAELIVQEYFTEPPGIVTCIEGETVKFECKVVDDNQTALWLKDGTDVSMLNRYKVERHGILHRLVVNETKLDDNGDFYVRIKNRVRWAKLNVQEYFTEPPVIMTCIEGETVKFEWNVLDDNQTALWFKDGTEVNTTEKYQVERHGKLHRLVVNETQLDDKGEYLVRIKNCVRWTNLKVQEYFTELPGTMICSEGETVKFEWNVLDDNQTALWFKNGNEVNTSERYKVERHGKLHRLVINETKLDDKGEYLVRIKNCVRWTTLKVQVIPTAIQHLSEKDKELYIDIIKTTMETRYFLRIVIIGENGVGKTCLLRRLLKRNITGVQSTDGIDVHRCKIRLRDGKWVFDEALDKRKELLTRIKMASHPNTAEDEILQFKADSLNTNGLQDNDDTKKSILDTSRYSSAIQTKIRHDISEDDNVKSELKSNTKDQSSTTIPNLPQVPEVKIERDSQYNTKLMTETVLQGLDNLLNGIDEVTVAADKYAECGILDFAGEKDYYATHPIFLNPNALHLLVANIMKEVKQITTEDGFDNIAEYLEFWLNSIHSCEVEDESEEETNAKFLYPPAIIVCTRIDECRDHMQEKKDNFRKQLLSVLGNEAKKKHLRDICYVSNIDSDEQEFNVLRETIFKYGKQVKTFAEKLPLKWIRLEQSLDVLREAELNILSWQDIVELSSKYSINSEDEINLFLKYQHKIGGVIYFESLKNYIILNQKWLANAFRCLVSTKFDSNLKLTDEWKTLEDTGKLEHSLIVKLFNKEPQLDFNKHSSHIINVMKEFGILVELTTLMENGQRQTLPTYYLPCMISAKASFTDIIDRFNATKHNCKRTPWLCFEFNFMPLDFFNHILCYYISHYSMCTEPQNSRMAIYHGMGVFFLDSTKFRKLTLCFCKNTIALQVWQWKDIKKGTCKAILKELRVITKAVTEKLETRRVSYTEKCKCSDGNIQIRAGRHSYNELLDLGDHYFCEEHSESHNIQDFFQTWFEDYTENKDCVLSGRKLKGIQNTRFKGKCHVCEKEPSVYWCHNCQRSMCKNCNNQHWESEDTTRHIVQHVHDMHSLDYSFKVQTVELISDIKVLHDGLLLIADHFGSQLVTYIAGKQQHTIPLSGGPFRIAVVDNNTVAVTLHHQLHAEIVDVRKRQVIKRLHLSGFGNEIMYSDKQLFVVTSFKSILVFNMSWNVERSIPVHEAPFAMCGGEAGRIYYAIYDKNVGTLYCIDKFGNTLFTITDPNVTMQKVIATDDEGHVLVKCCNPDKILRVSHDGKHSQIIVTQIPSFFNISYNLQSKSIVSFDHKAESDGTKTVYLYKKV